MSKLVRSTFVILCTLVIGAGAVVPGESAEREAPTKQLTLQIETAAPALQVDKRTKEQTQTVVRNRLVALGLTLDEADRKVAALTPTDLEKLGANPEQVAMAGIEDRTLILIAVILIAPSILLLLLI